MLARAADGSVRDALSLLDQAIAHGEGAVEEDTVHEMLGLVDRSLCFDILDAVMQGDAPTALALFDGQYQAGADPILLAEDLLDLTHWLTRLKLAPESGESPHASEAERVRGRDMAERLSMADVTRAWQMLLKGLSETRVAPIPMHAVEMLLIRLAYASRLPSPAEALASLAGHDVVRDEPTGIAGRHAMTIVAPANGATVASTVLPKPASDRPRGAQAAPVRRRRRCRIARRTSRPPKPSRVTEGSPTVEPVGSNILCGARGARPPT